MGVLIRKYRGVSKLTGIGKLSLVILLASLSSAMIDTIWAIYLKGLFQSDSLIGIISGILSAITILSFFVIIPFIEKSKKSLLYSSAVLLITLIYFLMAFNVSKTIFIILAILLTFLFSIKMTTFGIMVRDTSDKKKISRNEGLIYSFSNLAWVLGPLITGFILLDFGVRFVFIASAFLLLICFAIFNFLKIQDSNIMKKTHKDIFKNFTEFFKSGARVKSYILSSGVTIWWALVYLYMPLMMIDNGLSNSAIAIFLFSIAVPLIVFEYKFSQMATKHGQKIFFIIGYSSLFIITASIFFIQNIFIILGLVGFGSIAMAMLEPTTEAYFFDIIKNKKEENRFYGPYGTAIESGLLIGKLAPAFVIIFLPFKYIFPTFAIFFLILLGISIKSKNIIEWKRN